MHINLSPNNNYLKHKIFTVVVDKSFYHSTIIEHNIYNSYSLLVV